MPASSPRRTDESNISMTDQTHSSGGTGPSHRSVEIGVALFMGLLAVIGLYGASRVGVGWGAEGPQAGFFPFYVSAIVLIASAANFVSAIKSRDDGKIFAEWGQLSRVVSVIVPTAIYVG